MKSRFLDSLACRVCLCLAAVGLMLGVFASYGIPAYGHRWLPYFGERFVARMSEDLRTLVGPVVVKGSGYDGQFYARFATDPLLLQPESRSAFDNFQFRVRRPLFALTACLGGLGKPSAVLQAYSVQNIVFWLAFAGILLQWLPLTSWQNTYRYLAILFTVGWVDSIRLALLDGPALTVLAFAMLLAGFGRPWWGALVLGIAGLGKETSVLAASVFVTPPYFRRAAILRLAGKTCLVILPLALWMYYVSQIETNAYSTALGTPKNFSAPFAGWWTAVEALFASVSSGKLSIRTLFTLMFLVAMPVQAFALLAMWKPSDPWWRVGAVYAVFTFFLGYATWAGQWGSAARVCLPLTVAFNIVAPRTARWLVILGFGNMLSIIGLYALLTWKPPFPPKHAVVSEEVSAKYYFSWEEGWHAEDKGAAGFSRWSSGEAVLGIYSDRPGEFPVRLRFQTRATSPMEVGVYLLGQKVAGFPSGLQLSDVIELVIPLKQGENFLEFRPDKPAGLLPNDDRSLAFLLSGLHLKFTWKPALPLKNVSIFREEGAEYEFFWQEGWHGEEGDSFEAWRWSSGEAVLEIDSERPGEYPAKLRFQTRATSPMEVGVLMEGKQVAVFRPGLEFGAVTELVIPLKQGRNRLIFRPDKPAGKLPGDSRSLAFLLFDPNLKLIGKPPASPKSANTSGDAGAAYDLFWKEGWHGEETDLYDFWRWASGEAALEIYSQRSGEFPVRLRFRTRATSPMNVEVLLREERVAVFQAGGELSSVIELTIPLKQGSNRLVFRPDRPAEKVPDDGRPRTFLLFDLDLKKGRSP